MFYNISYSADKIPHSFEKVKKETQITKLPNINFINLNNKKLQLNKELRGNILILNFWALWCAPCVKEMPALNELASKLNKNNSTILFINQDKYEELNRVEKFIENLNINRANVLMDFDMQSSKNFKLRGIPTTLIIDKEGIIKWRIEGVIDWADKKLIDWLKEGAN